MSEFESPVINEQIIDQKPFVIRSHHLANYTLLFRRGSPYQNDPSGLARKERVSVYNSDDSGYAEDVLGFGDQANKFENNYRLALETFLQLPDNYPIEIAEGIPDDICRGCAVGEHCRRLRLYGRNTLRYDGAYMDRFLKNLDKLHLPKPTIVYEDVYFSHTERSRQARKVKTTAGVTKKIIKERALLSILLQVSHFLPFWPV